MWDSIHLDYVAVTDDEETTVAFRASQIQRCIDYLLEGGSVRAARRLGRKVGFLQNTTMWNAAFRRILDDPEMYRRYNDGCQGGRHA